MTGSKLFSVTCFVLYGATGLMAGLAPFFGKQSVSLGIFANTHLILALILWKWDRK